MPCVYGTRAPLRSWNPIRANLQVYAELARDSWRARRWADKLRVWLKPPGWRPADVAARWPKPPFAVDAFERFDPAASPRRQALALCLFAALLAATTLFLWHAHTLGWPERSGVRARRSPSLCGRRPAERGRIGAVRAGSGASRAGALSSQALDRGSP